MPRTPPIIMPNSPSVNWFSNNEKKKESKAFDNLDDFGPLSPFTYSPSDEDDSMSSNKTDNSKRPSRKSHPTRNDNNDETLYHKPPSNHSTQQTRHTSEKLSSQQYELVDDDDDDDNPNGTEISDNNSIADTPCDEEKFSIIVDGNFDENNGKRYIVVLNTISLDLRSEFKLYTDEYKEFKRHVDNAKRELLDYIQHRTSYFEERGSYLYQKWDSLRQLI